LASGDAAIAGIFSLKRVPNAMGGGSAGGMAAPVTLYTNTGCPFCAAARRELEAHGVTYVEINLSDRPERIPELLKLTRGRRIVPVLVDASGISVAPNGGRDF